MRRPHDPITLYRFALRCGDHGLADVLTRAFRGDPDLSRRADRELQALPRMRRATLRTRRAARALIRHLTAAAPAF